MIHIAESKPENDDKPVEVIVALCGQTGIILADARLTPADFDFVAPMWWERSNCPECRAAALDQRRRYMARKGVA